jgi:cupin superfamily acireductone dioxygenase involved in methionine salvage
MVVDEGLQHRSAPYMVQRVLVRAVKHVPGVVRHGFNATRARKFDALKTFSRRGK